MSWRIAAPGCSTTRPGDAQAVVGLLAVHEQRLVEAAERQELVAPDHHQRAGGRRDVDRRRRARCARGAPSSRPYVAVFGAISSPAASIVAPSGLTQQARSRPRSPGSPSSSARSGASQPGSTRPSKFTNASRRPRAGLGAAVAAGAEADVLLEPQRRAAASAARRPRQLPSVGPRVDHDALDARLGRAAASASSAAGQAARAVVVHEHHGQLGSARHAALYWQGCAGRSILLVAQLTPPSPLSGARRPAALAKYLQRRGHRVTVLTSLASGRGAMPGAARVVRTRDLLASRAELAPRRTSRRSRGSSQAAYGERRARSRRSWCPDLAVVGWLPFALPRALGLARARAVRLRDHHLAAAVGAPVGRALQRRGHAVDRRPARRLDVRPAARRRGRRALQERRDAALERALLGRADRRRRGHRPDRRRPRAAAAAARSTVITNGFDPEERAGDERRRARPRPPLARAHRAPERRRPLAAGARSTGCASSCAGAPRGAAARGRVRRPHVGRPGARCSPTRAWAASCGPSAASSAPAALALQRRADTLLVLAEGNDVRPARSVATGKLFEYLGGRPAGARAG